MKDKKKLIIIIVVAVIAVIGIVVGILFATGTIGGTPEEETTTTTLINPVIDEMQTMAPPATNDDYLSAEEMPNPSRNFEQSSVNMTIGANLTKEFAFQAPKDAIDESMTFDEASINNTRHTVYAEYTDGERYRYVEMFYTSNQFIEENYIGCVVIEGTSENEYSQSIYNAKHKEVVSSENVIDGDIYKYTATTTTDLKIVGEINNSTEEVKETYYLKGKEISESEFYKLYQETDPAVAHIYNS